MTGRGNKRRLTLGWRKLLLGLGCASVAVAGVCLARAAVGPTNVLVAAANPPAETRHEPDAPAPRPATTDYSASYVAVFAEGKNGITREELGEYLIARHGEKVEHLINKRIIEDACKAQGLEVTGEEIERKLAEDLKDLNIDRSRFVKEFLKARRKTLFEWKQDHLRPQLLMMKLCKDSLTVSEEDIQKAYEARYGEKIDCRIIEWSLGKVSPGNETTALAHLETEVRSVHARVAASEEAFAEAARKQKNNALAAGGGKVKAFGRYTLENADLEKAAFALRPGEVSPVIAVPTGFVVMKCDQRIVATTSVPYDKVREELAREVLERKGQKEIPKRFEELQKAAKATRELERKPSEEQPYGYSRDAQAGQAKTRVVATLYGGQTALTREDLGEYLIERYGATNLELLINKRIIENACKALNLSVTDAEVDVEFLTDAAKRKMDRNQFIAEVLAPNRTSVYEYKEDIVRPRLLLTKLVRDRVKVTEKDLLVAFDAHYGAKVECRMILWPNGEDSKLILQEYGRIRDDAKAFDEKARTQASPTLARNDGRLDRPIGRNTTGNETLEKAAFALQPGEVSSVIGTPEGLVVLKCVAHIPADAKVKLDDCRDELMKEVVEKKIEAEMPVLFAELRTQANPRPLIKDPNKGEDLQKSFKEEMARP